MSWCPESAFRGPTHTVLHSRLSGMPTSSSSRRAAVLEPCCGLEVMRGAVQVSHSSCSKYGLSSDTMALITLKMMRGSVQYSAWTAGRGLAA